jgi:hypothetical protein
LSIRNTLFSAAFILASSAAAHADGSWPIEAKGIDLGEVSGVAYYTVEADGFHAVTTLARSEGRTPLRIVSVLASRQSVVLSTPQQIGAVKISRNGNQVLVQKATVVSNWTIGRSVLQRAFENSVKVLEGCRWSNSRPAAPWLSDCWRRSPGSACLS